MALCESGLRDNGWRRSFSGSWLKERYGRDESFTYLNGRLEQLQDAFKIQKDNPAAWERAKHERLFAAAVEALVRKGMSKEDAEAELRSRIGTEDESQPDSPAVNAAPRKRRLRLRKREPESTLSPDSWR